MANTTNRMPTMIDVDTLIAAGIDPKTGLPIKATDSKVGCIQKPEIKKQLRILDEQDAINRYTWYNLPKGLNGRLMERILYYRGQGMFFKLKDKFYFLPYALDGSIDVYGRFTDVTPLPFNGKASADGKDNPWISGLTRQCVYEAQIPEDFMDDAGKPNIAAVLDMQETACVLIKDYSEQISQTNISRQILQEPILDLMADMPLFMRTALLNATGVRGLRVGDQNESASVEAASRAINRAALEGKKYVPVIGELDFQDLTDGSTGKAEEFLLAMQAMDNYRLSLYGLDNGGLFQKKSHMLEAEQKMNTGTNSLVYTDGLKYRQDACTIINSIWGLSVWCDKSESLEEIEQQEEEAYNETETEETKEEVEESETDDRDSE